MKTLSEELVKIAHWGLQDYVAVLFWGSGTICIDVCINSLLDKDKYAFVINNGSYSQRAVDILKAYGMRHWIKTTNRYNSRLKNYRRRN